MPDAAERLREVEQEIENIKAAVRFGRATETLLGMLEDAECRRNALLNGRVPESPADIQAKLEKVLADLPERVQAALEDLETLLARHQMDLSAKARRDLFPTGWSVGTAQSRFGAMPPKR